MGTLADFRGWLRLDLNDPAGATQRFSDADLNRAITRAVADLTDAAPKLTDTELAHPQSSRTIALSPATFPSLIDVDEVEYPYGLAGAEATYPPTLPPFRLAPDRLSLLLLTDAVPASGSRLRIRWSSPYSIQEGSTSVPTDLDPTVALGAAAHAMFAYSTPASDNFKYDDGATVAGIDDSMIPKEWRTRAQASLTQFQSTLSTLKRRRVSSSSRTVSWAPPHESAFWPPSP